MVRTTSARPSGGRPAVPAKMTSSILPPRSDLAPCSPMTQARASTTLDLPEPLGPTMQVMPGSSWSVVAEAKDLNPRRVRLFRYTWAPHGVTPGRAWVSLQPTPQGRLRRRAVRDGRLHRPGEASTSARPPYRRTTPNSWTRHPWADVGSATWPE